MILLILSEFGAVWIGWRKEGGPTKTLKMTGNARVELTDAPDPRPAEGEVVVEPVYSAICGSEMHDYRGDGRAEGNIGHESAGRVAELGAGVARLKPGDRVGVSSVVGCGRPDCPACARGQSTWCPNWRGYADMHAEKFVAAETACLKLPDSVPWREGVLLTGDGLGVPYHASRKIANPGIRTVAVFGLGPVGLGNVLVQTFLGRRVTGVDPSAYRRQAALGLGAREALDPAAGDVAAAVKQAADGAPDVCIEASGRPEALRNCFAIVRTAGTVLICGEQGPVPLSPSDDFIRRDITAVGSWFFHLAEFEGMLDLYRRGLRVGALISHVFPAAEADEAFRRFAAAETAKVLLQWRDPA